MRFRRGEIKVLIATEVPDWAFDLENVYWTVNYDVPDDITSYLKRIDRFGRIGSRAEAHIFAATDDDGEVCGSVAIGSRSYDGTKSGVRFTAVLRPVAMTLPLMTLLPWGS